LRSLENVARKEPVTIEEFTIEHILPQNPDLSAEWRESLGPDWVDIQDKYLHTLGNLTLTGYNSEYSDHPFLKKRDMEGGFAVSPLKLNEGLGQLETWDENAIIARAKRLSKLALGIWTRPSLSTEQLVKYRKEESKSQDQYSFEVHEWLRFTPERSALFDRLDSAVLALNPVVGRQIMKLYIAYKAETNFVDVVPLKSKLNLSLNVPLGELYDPRGLAGDVSKVGRWGNGDYQVGLDESTDFDYVLGLVRQSFERQLEEDL
jgi:predicted transport protein